jgi:glycosyltransferase involved in cell wall biosynthesis
MGPKVSVITATRNAAKHLPALASQVLRYPPELLEWIVVDSLSDDGTVEYLRGLRDDKLVWISERDSGIYDAWNKGVDRARGVWLMFAGADDLLGEGWIEACAQAPEVDLVYGDLEILDPRGRLLRRVEAKAWEVIAPQLRTRMLLPHPGLAHHRRLFEGRRFDTSYRIAGDFAFLSAAPVGSAVRLPLVQARMQLGGMSNNPAMVERAYQENRRVVSRHGAMPASDRFRWWVKRTFSRVSPAAFRAVQSLQWRLRQRI